MADEKKPDMNDLLRRAAFGVSDEELDADLAKHARQRKYTSMNHLLRAARGHALPEDDTTEDEGDK